MMLPKKKKKKSHITFGVTTATSKMSIIPDRTRRGMG